MKLKLISCNVFKREIETLAPLSPHTLDITFIELGEHIHSNTLRKKLQSMIDEAKDFDAVLLGYGLCGRATDGLIAREIPVVIPRSHDCCGILLGSRKRFEEIFSPMPSTPFSSVGFIDHGEYYYADGELMSGDNYAQLVEQYGEDDAKFIWDAMHPKLDGELQPIYFIHVPEIPSEAAREKCKANADEEGREYCEVDGDLRLISMLLQGEWNEDEFLVVPPGKSIKLVGDWDRIIQISPE